MIKNPDRPDRYIYPTFSDGITFEKFMSMDPIDKRLNLPDVGDTVVLQSLNWWNNSGNYIANDLLIKLFAGRECVVEYVKYEFGYTNDIQHIPRYKIYAIDACGGKQHLFDDFTVDMFSSWKKIDEAERQNLHLVQKNII